MSDLMKISQEAGVRDCPLAVRRWFAKALEAERTGNEAEALHFLDLAIEEEEKRKAA